MRTACTASLLQGRCTSGSRVLAQTLVLALSLAALIPAGCAPLDGLNAARDYHSHLGQGSDSIPGAYQGSQDGSDSMPGSSQPGSTEKQWGTGSASTAVGPSSEAERCAEHGCIVHLLRPVKGVEAHRPLSKRLQLCTRGIRALAAIKEPLALVAAVGPYHRCVCLRLCCYRQWTTSELWPVASTPKPIASTHSLSLFLPYAISSWEDVSQCCKFLGPTVASPFVPACHAVSLY